MSSLLEELKRASNTIDMALREAKETKQYVLAEEVDVKMNEIIENLWNAKKRFRKLMTEAE